MICPNCGTQLPDDAVFCGSCGSRIAAAPGPTPQVGLGQVPQDTAPSYYGTAVPSAEPTVQQEGAAEQSDKASIPGTIFGFLFPIVGFILFLVWKGNRPVAAKYAGIAALASFCISLFVNLFRYFVAS